MRLATEDAALDSYQNTLFLFSLARFRGLTGAYALTRRASSATRSGVAASSSFTCSRVHSLRMPTRDPVRNRGHRAALERGGRA
jgi:hypothetical protein